MVQNKKYKIRKKKIYEISLFQKKNVFEIIKEVKFISRNYFYTNYFKALNAKVTDKFIALKMQTL